MAHARMNLRERKKKKESVDVGRGSYQKSAEEMGILKVKFIDSYIGHGVFTSEKIEKGKLVCFYEGTLITAKEGMMKFLSEKEEVGSFLFFFNHNKKRLCIDATSSSGCGRMINDSHLAPNCKVVAEEGAKLAIYTIRNIAEGEELRYDYKDSSAFWRRKNAPRKPLYACPVTYQSKSDVNQSSSSKPLTPTTSLQVLGFPDSRNQSDSEETRKSVPEEVYSKDIDNSAGNEKIKSKQVQRSSLVTEFDLCKPGQTKEQSPQISEDMHLDIDMNVNEKFRSRAIQEELDPLPVQRSSLVTEFDLCKPGQTKEQSPQISEDMCLDTDISINEKFSTAIQEEPDPLPVQRSSLVTEFDLCKPGQTKEQSPQISKDMHLDTDININEKFRCTAIQEEPDPLPVQRSSLVTEFDLCKQDQTKEQSPQISEDMGLDTDISINEKFSTAIQEEPDPLPVQRSSLVTEFDLCKPGQTKEQSPQISEDMHLDTDININEKFRCTAIQEEPDPLPVQRSSLVTEFDLCKPGQTKEQSPQISKDMHLDTDININEKFRCTAIQEEPDPLPVQRSSLVTEFDLCKQDQTKEQSPQISEDMHLDTDININEKFRSSICSMEEYTDEEIDDKDSDEDYVPDSDSDSDDDMSDIVMADVDLSVFIKSDKHAEKTEEDEEDFEEDVFVGDGCSVETNTYVRHIEDETAKTIRVAVSKKSDIGKRIWDKRHSCLYCSKKYPKLARHLEQKHSGEIEVQRALAFKKSSKERKAVWRDIMNRGDLEHNTRVFQDQKGEIIPYKRPSSVRAGTDYIECDTCSGTFLRKDLWRHVKNRHPGKTQNTKNSRKYHQVASAVLIPVSEVADADFRVAILNKLSNDRISLIARNDDAIVLFGQRMFRKNGNKNHQHQYIRQKMRELARFLDCAREIDNTVESLRDLINSTKFLVCVEAVKRVCGYKGDSMTFNTPSLAQKLGHSLHKVARQLKIRAVKAGDHEMKEKALNFIEVYKEDWEIEVGHTALETLESQQYNKPRRIPLAEDLKALSDFLKNKADVLCEKFKTSEATETEWRELCEVTLSQVVLFNKKRSGESERLEVKQYLNGIEHGKNIQEEFLLSLSPLEKKLAEVIDRVELRGKKGRRVAILLPEKLKRQLDLLLKYRYIGGIKEDNKYMFARPGNAEFPVRATDALRKFGQECGAKHPELLTSTLFRKHIAVIAQMLNLKENELDVLAGFLGHDIRIHREFYRLPEDTTQVAKVSKLLLEMENGNMSKYKGKSLDEIQFNFEEPLEDDNSFEEDENETAALSVDKTTDDIECPSSSNPVIICSNKKVKLKKKNVCNRKMWGEEEKSAVHRQLGHFFRLDRLPGKHVVVEAQRKEPILGKRPWRQIVFFIKNHKASAKTLNK